MADTVEAAKKERRIVSWTPEEDELLRQQIALHGTQNWTLISSKFKDKTSRQCRRRWYTYLNTECKKGGWSSEEDMLLCEAQRIFGNRWTEIAKVVSGRTDNAVKNRFTTLTKKRAKFEAYSNENSDYINLNNKRLFNNDVAILFDSSIKRSNMPNLAENNRVNGFLNGKHSRPPLVAISQNKNVREEPEMLHISRNNAKPYVKDDMLNKFRGTFLKGNDPKIEALMQQAELLGTLALRVNMDRSNENLETVWKELHDFLLRTEDGDLSKCKIAEMDSLLNDFRKTMEKFMNSDSVEHELLGRKPEFQEESQGSSEYSIEPPLQLEQQNRLKNSSLGKNCGALEEGEPKGDIHVVHEKEDIMCVKVQEQGNEVSSALKTQYCSPTQSLPFYSLTEQIPSPKFSESERRFLLRTFDLASPSPKKNLIHSQRPLSCRRSLIDSL